MLDGTGRNFRKKKLYNVNQNSFLKHMVLDAVAPVTDEVYKYLRMTENVSCAITMIRVHTSIHGHRP